MDEAKLRRVSRNTHTINSITQFIGDEGADLDDMFMQEMVE